MNVYGLIGYPLEHSFSKKYFTEKFTKGKLDNCRFELFPLENIKLFPLLISKEKNIKGLAVTIPFKEDVVSYLNKIDKTAEIISAVNCIKFQGNILTGYNTDIIGFEKSFTPLLKSNHTKALVLGSGGSSKAVQYILTALKMPFLIVTRKKTAEKNFISYETVDQDIINEYPVIINCTPVGMYPNEHELPFIPYQYLTKKNLLYDLIYSPSLTNFLQKGLKYGASIKNGYEMLTIQAEEN